MKIVAIIQARMGSTRLPGKVMLDLAGEPMLMRCVNRTRRAQMLDKVVVATTVQPADDSIVRLCAEQGWACFRGSEDDVLDRYYRAALAHKADVVVRITSDCPLIEPEIVERVVQTFLAKQSQTDYVANFIHRTQAVLQRTYPRGQDVEVMSFSALSQAWHEDKNPAWREHVTPYIYRNPNLFKLQGVMNEVDHSDMRWTVDTPEDLAFVRRIYDYFGHDRFSWHEVLTLLEEHPEWLEINRYVPQKKVG